MGIVGGTAVVIIGVAVLYVALSIQNLPFSLFLQSDWSTPLMAIGVLITLIGLYGVAVD